MNNLANSQIKKSVKQSQHLDSDVSVDELIEDCAKLLEATPKQFLKYLNIALADVNSRKNRVQ